MATKEMSNPDFTQYRTTKTEYEEKQLTHRCPKCPLRYPTSSRLVQHMNEEHLAFVTETASMITRAGDRIPSLANGDKYKNTIATCPWCKQDCQTRKKLMMHLETAHKDDEESEDPKVAHKNKSNMATEEPRLKVFRISSGAPDSNVVQNLIAAIGSNNTREMGSNSNTKSDNKNSTKLQYRCFWCDASFRKRGKLMDHIDTLHKHNKDREAERHSMPTETPSSTNRSVHMRVGVPPFLPTVPSIAHHRPSKVDNKPSASVGGSCSFTLVGSLTQKPKMTSEEATPPNTCKFYLSKKDNPLANKKTAIPERLSQSDNNRRSSLPRLFEDAGSSSFTNGFPYGLLSMTAAAAIQQSHWPTLGIRSPLHPFYAPRFPMMMPSSEYLVNHAQPSLDQLTTSQRNQLSRMTAMSPLASNRSKTSSESPLDLTKSYNL